MVQTVYTTLLNVIIPLLLPIGVGALLARYQKFDTKPLLALYLYGLSPAIILDTLLTAEITHEDIWKTVGFALLNLVALKGLAALVARLLRLPAPEAAGLTLIANFTNSVNYGFPLVLLAFGQLGLDKASIYVISQMIIVNTIGVYFAARSEFSVRQAVKSVFSLPAVYAAVLALLLRLGQVELPAGLANGVSMMAAAYAPVVLTVLGSQMVKVRGAALQEREPGAFWAGMTIRLLLSPLVALLILKLLHIEGLLFSVLFILASMPVAVNSVILAERFNASSRLVSKCILWSTLLSFLYLPFLIGWV